MSEREMKTHKREWVERDRNVNPQMKLKYQERTGGYFAELATFSHLQTTLQ